MGEDVRHEYVEVDHVLRPSLEAVKGVEIGDRVRL